MFPGSMNTNKLNPFSSVCGISDNLPCACMLSMGTKLRDTLASLEEVSQSIGDLYTTGVVDGFTKELETQLVSTRLGHSTNSFNALRSEESMRQYFHRAQTRTAVLKTNGAQLLASVAAGQWRLSVWKPGQGWDTPALCNGTEGTLLLFPQAQ